jgi:hypothetical protein
LLEKLVHEVNRPFNEKLRFGVLGHGAEFPIAFISHWHNPDPSAFPDAPLSLISLDQFLKTIILECDGVSANVGDVIRACANAKGGVHYGPPENDRQELILDWDGRFQASKVETSLASLEGICRISLRALEPLVVQIRRVI